MSIGSLCTAGKFLEIDSGIGSRKMHVLILMRVQVETNNPGPSRETGKSLTVSRQSSSPSTKLTAP